jgi:hypothetical protein
MIVRLLAIPLFLSAVGFGQTCAPSRLLKPVDSIAASLGDPDCRLSDGSLFTTYSLTLPAPGRLQLNVASDDFPATATLRDSTGRKIEGGQSMDKTIERGEYSVIVNAQNAGQLGKFVINTAFTQEPNTLCRAITRIGLNQSRPGRLADSSCRLPDNTPYDGYLLNSFGSGILEITVDSTDFTGLLILRGDDGTALVSDSKSVALSILEDSAYTIIAAGGNADSRGDYTLTVKFTPADDATCRSQKSLLTPQDVTGSVTADSCAFGTNTRFQYYELTLTDAGLVDLRVQPGAEVPTRIDLLDDSGRLVAQDIAGGGSNRPILRQQLSAGFYYVLVNAATAVDYTLQYRFNPGLPATCPSLELKTGTQTGSFDGASSCRSISAMQDSYRVNLASPGTLDVAITSGGYLLLTDAKDNVLTQGSGELLADLKPGNYTLVAQSLAPAAYAVNTQFTARNLTCPSPTRVAISSGGFNQGSATLGVGTCRGADGQPLDTYEFATTSAGVVGIFMISQQLDSYLYLTDTQGNVLRRDDDSYGYPDAMILQWLPAGTYRINATASGGQQGGQYTLYLGFASGDRPPGCLPAGDLNPGTIQKTFAVSSCLWLDDSFADVYRLSVGAPTNLDVTATLTRADIGLDLLDAKGNLVDTVDNSNGGTSAHLTTPVEAGTYYVVAKSFGGLTGSYSLAVK